MRHICHFRDILRPAHGNVGLHFFQPGKVDRSHRSSLSVSDAEGQFPADAPRVHDHERFRSRCPGRSDQGKHEVLRCVRDIDEDALASLQSCGVTGEDSGQSIEAGVGHGKFLKGEGFNTKTDSNFWEEV